MALLIVVMLVLVAVALLIVVMLVLVAMALLIVVMLVLVAVALLVVVVLVLVAMALLVVVMLVLVAMALLIVVMMVMLVMVLVLLLESGESVSESVAVLHSGENVLTLQLVPGGSHDDGLGVQLAQAADAVLDLVLGGTLGMREDDGGGVGDLVAVKFTEVLQIHLALIYVGNGGEAIEHRAVLLGGLCRADNVREFANSGGLDDDSVGLELVEHAAQSLGKIAHQGTADTAGIHLGDLDARVGKKSAVNADLTKLVLDQHELFTLVRLGDQLFDQSGLSRTEKARKNINFRHFSSSFQICTNFHDNIIPPRRGKVNIYK